MNLSEDQMITMLELVNGTHEPSLAELREWAWDQKWHQYRSRILREAALIRFVDQGLAEPLYHPGLDRWRFVPTDAPEWIENDDEWFEGEEEMGDDE